MKNYPKALKRKLLNTVSQIRKELPKHTADPKRDFKRNRKLPFETLCKTILFMSGQSLNVELQRQFHYVPTAATTSAFVQQRGKLLPTAFEEILRRFTYQNRPIRRWNGYTLLAADGSHVQIPSDIHDKATYRNIFPGFEIHPCTDTLSCQKAPIYQTGDLFQNDALQFRFPASSPCRFYTA